MKKWFKEETSYELFKVLTLAGFMIVLFTLGIKNISVVKGWFSNFVRIASPFIWGGAIALILLSTSRKIENTLPKEMPGKRKRFVSSLLSVVLFIGLIVVLVAILVPQLAVSVSQLASLIEGFSSNASKWLEVISKELHLSTDISGMIYNYSREIINGLWKFAQSSIPSIINATLVAGKAVGNFVIGFIVALYILLDRENLYKELRSLMRAILSDKAYLRGRKIVRLASEKFSKFFTGKIIDSAIIGVLCFVVMIILKLDFALLISVIVGVTNIIPFFGPFIGAVPSAFILLIVSPKDALIFVVMVLILQQIDGNIIGPRILGDSVGLSSLWIMVAIIVGGGYFGFVGMLLGVPVFAILYFTVKEYVVDKTSQKGELKD